MKLNDFPLFYRTMVKRGISIKELSEELGVKHQTLYQWKSRQTAPKTERLKHLADYLDIPIDTLYKDFYA